MKPVLLLIPGMLNDATIWRGTAERLAPLADVRTMDTLGQASIAQMADAAWQAVADVPAAAPLLIAGFSLGGYVGLHMLAQPRRRLAGAALVSTSAQPESPEGRLRREKTIQAIGADFARVVDGVLQLGLCDAGASVVGDLRAMMLAIDPAIAIRQTRAIMGRADLRAQLARLDLPIAVIVGAQDRITPPSLSEELAALVPGAQLTRVEGAGHLLPAEQPGRLADALARLLEKVGAQTPG